MARKLGCTKMWRSCVLPFFVIIIFVVMGGLLVTRINQSASNDQFCSEEDEIYQALQANADDWLEYFFGTPSHQIPVEISIQGRKYLVFGDLTSNGEKLFYVSVAPDWPVTPQGLKGYLYAASGIIPPNYWPLAYKTKRLRGNVYCYSEYDIE